MVQITIPEAFVFFGAIVLGAIIGLSSNFLVTSAYQVFEKRLKEISLVIFLCSLIVFAFAVGAGLFWFHFLSQMEYSPSIMDNSTCISQNVTYIVNNYSYNVTEINFDDKTCAFSIEELKKLINKQPRNF